MVTPTCPPHPLEAKTPPSYHLGFRAMIEFCRNKFAFISTPLEQHNDVVLKLVL
jgi:hypothetical protein